MGIKKTNFTSLYASMRSKGFPLIAQRNADLCNSSTISIGSSKGETMLQTSFLLKSLAIGITVIPLILVAGCQRADASKALATIGQSGSTGDYQIGENTKTADTGPVRLARVSYLTGQVTWRPNSTTEWSTASNNLPIRQGAQVWAKSGSRAELQFDDGSTMRLGGGAVATLQNMYSDDQGEFTEVKLVDGISTVYLRNKQSRYQFDTPRASVKAYGPSELRLGVGDVVEISCISGTAELAGQQGNYVMHERDRISIRDDTTPYEVLRVPDPDQWDTFNTSRDAITTHHNQYLPSNIDLVAGDLDRYGDWRDDSSYGHVWVPRVREHNWRPYHDGRWVWVSPWGWTWVGNEDWGYAPYHYGTWVRGSYGWAWVPGPAVQHWSPGVVDFVDDDSYVSWVPLSPREVVYPAAIDIGFHSGDWWLSFSIGQVASYYPSGRDRCEPRPWDNRYTNQQINIYNITNNYNAGANNYVRNSQFIPQNAVRYAGMTSATRGAFLNGGQFLAPGADPHGSAFRNGRSFNGAPGHNGLISGPPLLRPSPRSFTPSRTFVQAGGPPQRSLERAVVRNGMPKAIVDRTNHTPIGKTFTPPGHEAMATRRIVENHAQGVAPNNGRGTILGEPVGPPQRSGVGNGKGAVKGNGKAIGNGGIRGNGGAISNSGIKGSGHAVGNGGAKGGGHAVGNSGAKGGGHAVGNSGAKGGGHAIGNSGAKGGGHAVGNSGAKGGGHAVGNSGAKGGGHAVGNGGAKGGGHAVGNGGAKGGGKAVDKGKGNTGKGAGSGGKDKGKDK